MLARPFWIWRFSFFFFFGASSGAASATAVSTAVFSLTSSSLIFSACRELNLRSWHQISCGRFPSSCGRFLGPFGYWSSFSDREPAILWHDDFPGNILFLSDV